MKLYRSIFASFGGKNVPCVDQILYGNTNYNIEDNSKLLQLIINYITDTRRFGLLFVFINCFYFVLSACKQLSHFNFTSQKLRCWNHAHTIVLFNVYEWLYAWERHCKALCLLFDPINMFKPKYSICKMVKCHLCQINGICASYE